MRGGGVGGEAAFCPHGAHCRADRFQIQTFQTVKVNHSTGPTWVIVAQGQGVRGELQLDAACCQGGAWCALQPTLAWAYIFWWVVGSACCGVSVLPLADPVPVTPLKRRSAGEDTGVEVAVQGRSRAGGGGGEEGGKP